MRKVCQKRQKWSEREQVSKTSEAYKSQWEKEALARQKSQLRGHELSIMGLNIVAKVLVTIRAASCVLLIFGILSMNTRTHSPMIETTTSSLDSVIPYTADTRMFHSIY